MSQLVLHCTFAVVVAGRLFFRASTPLLLQTTFVSSRTPLSLWGIGGERRRALLSNKLQMQALNLFFFQNCRRVQQTLLTLPCPSPEMKEADEGFQLPLHFLFLLNSWLSFLLFFSFLLCPFFPLPTHPQLSQPPPPSPSLLDVLLLEPL